jgi:hypothetical protein
MPGRTGGGVTLGFRTRSNGAMGPGRSPFSFSSMPDSMETTRGSRTRSMPALGGGMGLGSMPRPLAPTRMSVMPPSFGYPFRQPPSLLGPSAAGAGMSM